MSDIPAPLESVLASALTEALTPVVNDRLTNYLDRYGVVGAIARLQEVATNLGADSIDFSDFNEDELFEFNEHLVFVLSSGCPVSAEAFEEAHDAVLIGREFAETTPADDNRIDAAVKSYQALANGQQATTDAGVDIMDQLESELDDVSDQALASAVEDQLDFLAQDIEELGLDRVLELMNRYGDRLGIDFSDYSEQEVEDFTEIWLNTYFTGIVSVKTALLTAHDFIVAKRTENGLKDAAAKPEDVSHELFRVYHYCTHGTFFELSVVRPQTLTVGEDGDHIFTLADGNTQIVPGDFVDFDVVNVPVEAEAA